MTTPRPRTTARRTALAAAVAVAGIGGLALPATSSAGCPPNGDPEIANCPNNHQTPSAGGITGTVSVRTTLGVRRATQDAARQYRQLRNGAKVRIVCQTRGGVVHGTFGTSRLWNKLTDGGYVSDAYVYTGTDGRATRRC